MSVQKEMQHRFGRLQAIPLDQVRDTFQDLSRSAGHCFFGKYDCKRDIPQCELDECERVLQYKGPKDLPPYMISFRNQIRKLEPKQRIILVSPGPLAMVEKRFAWPLQKAMEHEVYPRPWATGWCWFASGGSQVAPFIEDPTTVSIDFEKFDYSPPTFLIRKMFKMMMSLFDLTPKELAIFKGISRSHVDSLAKYGDRVYHLDQGIRTGSSFTHVLGTLVCIVLIRYLCGNDISSVSYGDDGMYRGGPPLKTLCRRAESTSFRISRTKSKHGVQWLGYKWRDDRWVCEDPDRRWAQYFWPEKPGCPEARLQALFLNCLSDPMRVPLKKALVELSLGVVLQATAELIGAHRYPITIEPGADIFEIEKRMKRYHRLD